jgi:phenylacetate-CoA ligase
MHPWLVNRVVFPLQERLKGKPTCRRLKELEQTQWLAPERIRELQLRRLRTHLEFAYREVPYYHRLLSDHDLQPWRVQTFEDFARIPFLTKALIREHLDDLQPRRGVGRVKRVTTGGSTGTPLSVLADMQRWAFVDAARLRAHRWFGVDVGVREVALWSSPIELGRYDRLRRIRDHLINSRLLSAFDMGEASLERYAEFIRRYRPLKIFAYAGALYLLARYLERRGWRPEPGWPRAAFTTAEPLHDDQRETIQRVLGCAVSAEYGCREGGLVANECPSGGLHVNAEGIHVEVLDESIGGDSEVGELVITNMDSLATPIIRYRVEDVVAGLTDGPCACGRGLPCLGRIDGRRSDFLVTPGGRVLHGRAAAYIVREYPSIREFRIVQEGLDRLSVKIVADDGFSDEIADTVAARLSRLLDGAATVDVQVVDAVDRLGSGKRHDVISRIANAHLEALALRDA